MLSENAIRGFRHSLDARGGIRPWIKGFCRKNRWCSLYKNDVTSAVFALCPVGGCWSSRQCDALDNNAIPVVLSVHMVMAFENQIDWSELQEQVMRKSSEVAKERSSRV